MALDAERKRELLEAWLAQHAAFRRPLHDGGPPDDAVILAGLRAHLPLVRESVYVLVGRAAPAIPLYIGRSANPLSLWQDHLRDYRNGVPRYDRWRAFFAAPLDLS